jgi:hypothetical protein
VCSIHTPTSKQIKMIDFIKTYIKYVVFHKWNRLSIESIEFLEKHWEHKPKSGIKFWLYRKIKKINGFLD